MSIFVDTSALIALLNADDASHARAAEIWTRLIEAGEDMVTTSYVLIEIFALSQGYLGSDASTLLSKDVVPLLRTIWIGPDLRTELTQRYQAARHIKSLTDVASFDTMERLGIRRAFSFDQQFAEQGFVII